MRAHGGGAGWGQGRGLGDMGLEACVGGQGGWDVRGKGVAACRQNSADWRGKQG